MAPTYPQVSSGMKLHQVLRLGLFQACLGALAVIFAGLLNRIMITELGMPAVLVGGALAFEQFMAPTRVLFGHVSDARPLGGATERLHLDRHTAVHRFGGAGRAAHLSGGVGV